MKDFIKTILENHFGKEAQDIYNNSYLIRYLDSKTGAIYGDSKTRRSLASIYAIYSILSFYIKDFYNNPKAYKQFEGYDYARLFVFCHGLYGGKKLQNHALNNRVNGEFENKFRAIGKNLIIINDGKYALHIDFLYVGDVDISKSVFDIIGEYIRLLQQKDSQLSFDIEELRKLRNVKRRQNKIHDMLNEKSEARVFEIISYVILKTYYKNTKVYIGFDRQNLEEKYLQLFKTGRTNANDGGIDFVMRPLGRFFQVTEVNAYDKYLMDIDKVLHFPITFVIKTDKDKSIIQKEVNDYIENRSGGMKIIKDSYREAIEEIVTIKDLRKWLYELSDNDMDSLLKDLEIYYKLEMNFI
ncbi:MAG: hypothetical protein LE178_01815 [Endomicrobium sp.]|nr:hypothetical protein [Endomicrobium sp.]